MTKFVGWIPQWREKEPEPSAAWEKDTPEEAAVEEFSNALSYKNATRDVRAKVWVKNLVTGEVTQHPLFFDARANEIRPAK